MSDHIAENLVIDLMNLQGIIQKKVGGALSMHGLGLSDYFVLNQLYLAPAQKMRRSELAERVGLSPSGITRLLNPLEKIGLVENYFCPEDCDFENQGGIYRILDLIREAEVSVKVASFSFTHEDLADELLKADIMGVDVDVIVERRQRNVQGSQYTRLKDFGVNIKVDGNKNNMHHKFAIIDEKIVVFGSPNFSLSGFNRNDENMLVIYNENLALGFVREFDRLFGLGERI